MFLIVFGTRPECIKLAPLIKEFDTRKIEYGVCITGQHREMLDPFVRFFDIPVDYRLDVMRPNQDLFHITTEVMLKVRGVLELLQPDAVIVQGDTTTTLATALASFYQQLPIAHVEAGLRTRDNYNPFPEEINRRLTDHLSTWCFAPTPRNRGNLLTEGIPGERIWVTGNTVVDAIRMIINDERFKRIRSPMVLNEGRRLILVTTHRRENFNGGIANVCRALVQIVRNYVDVEVMYSVHLNPNVSGIVRRNLSDIERIHLLEPLDYLSFLKLLEQSYLVLTDSGGIQEEAPTFRKPVLVLREVTERPEGIDMGVAKLVGTDPERIVREVGQLLEDGVAYEAMVTGVNPYGDGKASERIVNILTDKHQVR